MKQITAFTADPSQNVTLILDNGDKVAFSMKYFPNQTGWFYSFTFGSFSVFNRRIVTSPNMIRSLRGFLPFGFAITTSDGYEPIYIDDFVNGRTSFYLLNSDDVSAIEGLITAR